ncbi:unnamed protein product [Absidia cylindrospora]
MPSLQIIDQEDSNTKSSPTSQQPLCYICQEKASNYICPRCNLRYCSLACYKDQKHGSCTETFYKDNVMAEMRSMDSDDLNKTSMQKILNKFEAENDQLNAHEQQQSLVRNESDNTLKTLEQQFEDMDIAKTDASLIWDLLSPQERHDFQALMKMDAWQGLDLPEYEPWWTVPVSVVTDLDSDHGDDIGVSDIPPLPTAIPALSAILKSPPAPHLIFHLLHVLMTYAYLARQTMGDLADDIEYGVQSTYCLSHAVLFSTATNSNNPFQGIGDVLTDIRRQINDLEHQNSITSSALDIMLLQDAEYLLTHGKDYAIRALGEIYQLLDHASKDKTLVLPSLSSSSTSAAATRKKVGLAARKAYFFMAYANHLKHSQEEDQQQHVELLVMAIRTEYRRLQHDQDVFDAHRKVAKDALTERKQALQNNAGGSSKITELV